LKKTSKKFLINLDFAFFRALPYLPNLMKTLGFAQTPHAFLKESDTKNFYTKLRFAEEY